MYVYPASDLGGIAQYILSIVRYLPRDKYDIHVAVFGNGPLCELLKHESISVHHQKVDYSFFSFIQAIFSFRKFLKVKNFDLIHAHNAKAGFLSSIANKNFASRIVYTGHSFRFEQKKCFITRALFFRFERFICRSSTFITCLSKTELDFGISKGLLDNRKTSIVSMSIDVNRFLNVSREEAENRREKFNIPKDAFVVGMVGRISYEKSPITFLKVASILNSQLREVHFLWVGDGDMKGKLIRTANKFGLSDKMKITGQQVPEEIPKLLSAIDVWLLTSKIEAMPIALMEAMAAKKLIVATNVGSIHEIIKDNITGWLYNVGDYHTAALLVKKIYDDKRKSNEIGKAAHDLIVNQYSPKEKMSKDYQTIYENILGYD